MKKSKRNSSIIVDHGLMPYRASLINFYDRELLEIDKWCEKTFATDTWRRAGIYPGYIYFVKEKDMTLFMLKWAR